MLTRAISGAVFVIIMVGAILLGPATFTALLVFVGFMGLFELYKNIEKTGRTQFNGLQKPAILFGTLSLFLYVFLQFWPNDQLYYLIPVLVFIPFGISVFKPVENGVQIQAYIYLGFAYVVFSFAMLSHWASFYYGYDVKYLLGGIILIWCNDVFAYLTGRMLGKHKLIERVSPNKTIEGTAGGLLFAILASLLYAWLNDEPLLAWAGFGLLCGICATIGDLVESVMKRSLGVKDMGNIMPGHGGVLDRFDALMFAAPFGAAYIHLFMV